MKIKSSNGNRLRCFRSGDRSEYLANYALAPIAFITPVPRQEDFGIIDFHCVLTRDEGRDVIPEGAFNLQVKSDASKLKLNSKKVRWISTNMDCPLFICVVTKVNPKKDEPRIRLYSCANMWSALFFRMHPLSVTLMPDKTHPSGEPFVHHWQNSEAEEGEFDVYLGPPVIDYHLTEFEEAAREGRVFELMNAWIKFDRINVALMRLGRAAACHFKDTRKNEMPTIISRHIFNRTEVNQHGLLDKVHPLLESLRESYLRRSMEPMCADQIDALRVAQNINALMACFEKDAAISNKTAIERFLLE